MKIQITLLAFTFLVNPSWGQRKFNIGIEGGLGTTKLYGTNFGDSKMGMELGMNCTLPFNEKAGLKTGLYYQNKGSQNEFIFYAENGDEIGRSNEVFNLNYITLPALATLQLGTKLRYHFGLGPYLSYLISAKYNWSNSTLDPIQHYPIDSQYNQWDWGLMAEAGVKYTLMDLYTISLILRDSFGLYDIKKPTLYPMEPWNTNALNILLGMTYNFGR